MTSTRPDAEARKIPWIKMGGLFCAAFVFLGVGYYLGIRKHTTGYLIRQLTDGHLDDQIRAVRILGERLSNEAVEQATIRALSSRHPALRLQALRALAWHGRPESRFLEPVSACLLDDHWSVSAEAALALCKYPYDTLGPALPTIATALLRNEHVRSIGFTIIVAQFHAGPDKRDWATSVLIELLKAPGRKVDRIRAMQLLRHYHVYSPEVLNAVFPLLKVHADEEGYLAALVLAEALVQHPDLLSQFQDTITRLPKTGPVLLLQEGLKESEPAA